MNNKHVIVSVFAIIVLMATSGSVAADEPQLYGATPVGSNFTYQGRLNQGGSPANGTFDFEFYLFDALAYGNQIGMAVIVNDLPVADGYFTVLLDFGSTAFMGQARYLEVRVRLGGDTGFFTILSPRQELIATPYAIYSLSAPWSGITGVPEGFADGIDNDTTYSAGYGLTLSAGQFSVDTTIIQRRVTGACASGSSIRVINLDGSVTCETDDDTTGFWSLTGNADTNPTTNYLGTSDNTAFEVRVNGTRAMRFEPHSYGPNLIGGYSGNTLTSGVYGATLFGGGIFSFISQPNNITDLFGTVSGGIGNQAGNGSRELGDANFATVAGGIANIASGWGTTVGGGVLNQASGDYSTIGGGEYITTMGTAVTVAGGSWITATSDYASIGGGSHNNATGIGATVGGGYDNTSSGTYAMISGGTGNTASMGYTTVGGGYENAASMVHATVGGGHGNSASGWASTIPGGYDNSASGDYSFAAGLNAKANNQGCFVWGDASIPDITCSVDNRWMARASGGVYFYSNSSLTTGVYMAANDSGWSAVSNPALKEHFSTIDTQALVANLASIPITTWNYKSATENFRHIGPMANDFNALLPGLGGADEMAINSIDADGIALASIQGLYQIILEKDAHITELEARVSALETSQGTQVIQSSQSHFNLNNWLPGLFGVLGMVAGVLITRRKGGRQ